MTNDYKQKSQDAAKALVLLIGRGSAIQSDRLGFWIDPDDLMEVRREVYEELKREFEGK